MPESNRVRFDEAWLRALSFMNDHADLASATTVLIRDLTGKIRVALDDRDNPASVPTSDARQDLAKLLDSELGAFSPGPESLFLFASEMFAPEEVFASSDALWADPGKRHFRVLERSITGADWLRLPFAPSTTPRVTLYGVKGGVGRSTATAVLAWRLSQIGRRVLVLDLDLESPGVGTTLIAEGQTPDFGLIDWFVEDIAGQADDGFLRDLTVNSQLGRGGSELLVVPASGRPRKGYSYLPKLARAYAEIETQDLGLTTFGDRLHRAIANLEMIHRPDITLLDSRAGLHDIAATAVTRMGAIGLLFAVNTTQTWQAYSVLFQAWQEHFDRAEPFRENLKIVAAQIPETETAAYLEGFEQNAYDLFSNHLYVETPAGEESDFNFDPSDSDAPHSPLRIHWSRAFQQFDPVRQPEAVTDEQLRSAFGDFVKGVSLLAFGEVAE